MQDNQSRDTETTLVPFRERLREGVIVCDGAMGTMLYSKGIFINRCFDELNLSQPDMVAEIHREYFKAGAEILETNTFGANRFKLRLHGLERKVREINERGAEIAREACDSKVYIAGSIGPIGKPLEPSGRIRQQEAFDAFAEQAQALIEGGVDLIVLETISDLNEMLTAIDALRSLSDIPLVAQMTIGDDTRTPYGDPPEKVAKTLMRTEVDVIGYNCSVGPRVMLEAIKVLSRYASNLMISAQPNAGAPQSIEDRFIYLTSPEYIAEYGRRFVESGVTMIGGCCGTTPAHIKALKNALSSLRPTRTSFPDIEVGDERQAEVEVTPTEKKSPLAEKMMKGFVSSVEIAPPRGTDLSQVMLGAELLHDGGIDAINIPDGPRASARMSPMALAVKIKRKVGIETILHYCCRDRNLLGMQSDLLGGYALGLRNVLIITGDPPKLGDYPDATAVFDIDSIGLVRMTNLLNRGMDLAGNPIGAPSSFFIGVGANPGAYNFDREIRRFHEKVEAGAEYVMTQPIYDPRYLERFIGAIKEIDIPILVGILPLASHANAEFLHNEVPGMSIPDPIRERMRRAGSGKAAIDEGVRIAREALEAARGMEKVRGVYIMPPFERYELALKILA
jgi:homocysteine S-methyltransferase